MRKKLRAGGQAALRLARHREVRQLVMFAVSGGISTAVYGLVAGALGVLTVWPALVVHTVGFAAGIPLSYLLQSRLTFGYKGRQKGAVGRFCTLACVTYGLSSLAVVGFNHYGLPPLAITLVQMVLIPALSFVSMRVWVFSVRE